MHLGIVIEAAPDQENQNLLANGDTSVHNPGRILATPFKISRQDLQIIIIQPNRTEPDIPPKPVPQLVRFPSLVDELRNCRSVCACGGTEWCRLVVVMEIMVVIGVMVLFVAEVMALLLRTEAVAIVCEAEFFQSHKH